MMGESGSALFNNWPARTSPDYDWIVAATYQRVFVGLCGCIRSCLSKPAFVHLPVEALIVTIQRMVTLNPSMVWLTSFLMNVHIVLLGVVYGVGYVMCNV